MLHEQKAALMDPTQTVKVHGEFNDMRACLEVTIVPGSFGGHETVDVWYTLLLDSGLPPREDGEPQYLVIFNSQMGYSLPAVQRDLHQFEQSLRDEWTHERGCYAISDEQVEAIMTRVSVAPPAHIWN